MQGYKRYSSKFPRTLMLLTALMMSAVFFLFFGNGTDSNRSLYQWVESVCGGFPREVLLLLSGAAVYFIASKNIRHEVVLGKVSLAGGMAMIVTSLGVAVWAYLCGYPVFSYLALMSLTFGIIFAFHGRGTNIYFMILLLCFFALPTSPLEPLGPFFQLVTSRVTQMVICVLGIDFTSHGTRMFLDGFGYQIAEVCSGTRSMELALKVSIVICIFYPMGWAGRFLFIGLSVFVGAVSNLVRIAIVLWFGVWKGSEFAMSMGHEVVGPILGFGIILAYFFLASFFLARRFRKNKKACCERRMDRQAPVLFAFAAACLCIAAGICVVVGPPAALPGSFAFKQISECDAAGSWKRVNGFYCDSPGCMYSFPAGNSAENSNSKKCPICNSGIQTASLSALRTNVEENVEVFRTRYRSSQSNREVALTIVRGGRPGLSLCSPVWYLRTVGASVDYGFREKLNIADSQTQVHRITFKGDMGNRKTSNFSGIYWYVSDDQVSASRFRLKSAFERFSKDEWVCLAYCEQYDGSDVELLEFTCELIENGLQQIL
jgi:exosortase